MAKTDQKRIIQITLSITTIFCNLNCISQKKEATPNNQEDCVSSVFFATFDNQGRKEYVYRSTTLQVCGLLDNNLRIDRSDPGTEDCPADVLCSNGEKDCSDPKPSMCMQDTHCQPGFACACTTAHQGFTDTEELDPIYPLTELTYKNACVPEECTSSKDCDGSPCSLSTDGCNAIGYFCRTNQDECNGDLDCSEKREGFCIYNLERKVWACRSQSSCP